ncbi:MAG: MBL fold metallo-hydrolase [Clostridiales bacterium]|nr:MBL fold metallo-hydrolase [Clostridiales bacterium]
MIEVEYLGHSCFRIKAPEGRFVTDPFFEDIGYEMPKVRADYVTISHGHYDHCNAMAVDAEEVFADAYEFLDGAVVGKTCYHDDKQGTLRGENIMFRFTLDGKTLCHMGDVGEPLNPELLAFLKGTDILLIPVGGVYTITADQAKEYVDAIQPKLVIPMHYDDSESNIRLDPVEDFMRLFNHECVSFAEGKYEIEDLPEGEPHLVILKRRD